MRLYAFLLRLFKSHFLQWSDYPGVLPISRAKKLFKRDLTQEEMCVRGILVTGLTDEDMEILDAFEGDVSCQIHSVAAFDSDH